MAIVKPQKRDCDHCKNNDLCFLTRDVEKALHGGTRVRMLNIDGKGAPGSFTDVYKALARACLKFDYDEEVSKPAVVSSQ